MASVQTLITIVSVNVVLMENVWTALDVYLKKLPVRAVRRRIACRGFGSSFEDADWPSWTSRVLVARGVWFYIVIIIFFS